MAIDKLRRFLLLLAIGTLAIFECRMAGALPAYLEAVQSAYKFKSSGVVDNKSCNLCHAGSTTRRV